MDMFDLSEVIEVIGIDAIRAKNWTVGRPLKITPSIRKARPGSSSLYGLKDLYLIALLDELWKSGLTGKSLQRILSLSLEIQKAFDDPKKSALIFHMRKLETQIELLSKEKKLSDLHGMKGCLVHHIVDLAALKTTIDKKIAKMPAPA